jgi:hypothetical protein
MDANHRDRVAYKIAITINGFKGGENTKN